MKSLLQTFLLLALFLLIGCQENSKTSKIIAGVSKETNALGKIVYTTTCNSCHANNASVKSKAPSVGQLSRMSPKSIFSSLTTGKMKAQAAGLSDLEKRAVAEFLTQRSLKETEFPKEAFTTFVLPENPTYFSGHGGNLEGTGYVKDSKINAENVNTLEVEWVFGFDQATQVRSKPAVVGDWLIMGSEFGNVYCLNRKTGKIGWQFQADAAIRGAVAVAGNPLNVYFADYTTNVYSLDVKTGKLLWKQRSGKHPQSAVTGSVAVIENSVIVPLTSFEVLSAQDPEFDCCTSSGEVVSLDTNSGNIKWRHRVIEEEAKESGKKSNGKSFFGPSGAIVWGSPTIDIERGLVYFGTGENYTDPPTETSDAIQALYFETGELVWSYQATEKDTWNLACPDNPNCPENEGPDLDFGMAPILVKGALDGNDILVVGQKSGVVHALNPENGTIIWQTRIGKGGALGGIHWGMATDGKELYAPNADNVLALDSSNPSIKASPGLYALNVGTGKVNWSQPTPVAEEGKIQANSAAPLALKDVVFAGTLDGHIRAYHGKTGAILWDDDTVKPYETVNGVLGKGGSLDGPSPVVYDDMLYVNSGYGSFGEIPGNVLIAYKLNSTK